MKNVKYVKYIVYIISMNLLITSKSAAFEVGKDAFEILENGKIIHMVEDLKGRDDRNFFYKKTYSVIYKSTPFISPRASASPDSSINSHELNNIFLLGVKEDAKFEPFQVLPSSIYHIS